VKQAASLVLLAAMSVMTLAGGCGGSSGSGPRDATAADNRAADQRLQGRWRIAAFQPVTPLDPVMASMLSFYQPTMIVEVAEGRIRALTSDGGVHFDRRYEVREALGSRFQIVVYDDSNVAQTSYCELQPDGSLRVKTSSPWRGDAHLVRAG
jgi:hypothetical protein